MDTWKKFWISSCLTTFPSLAKSARKPMRSVFMLLYMEMAWTCLTLSIWERTSIPCSNCPFPLSPEPLPLFKNKVFFYIFLYFPKIRVNIFQKSTPLSYTICPYFLLFPLPPHLSQFFTNRPCFLLFPTPLHQFPLFFTILPSSSPFAPVFFTISHCFLLFATFFTTWPCFPPEMRFKNINYLINMHHNLELTSSVRQLLTYSETH